MYIIQSDRLRIEVAAPEESPNNTYRFDRAGFITEVVLDGKHRFCASEPNNLSHPCSGGRGICNEFIFPAADDANPGEYFLKPGVGLLLKEKDEPYHFFNKYQMKPFHITVEQQSDNTIIFVTEPQICMGYALRQRKVVSVKENKLSMHLHLENTGKHSFKAEEYCHNFLTINSMGLGPDYTLHIPSLTDRGTELLMGNLTGNGQGFSFTEYSSKPVFYPIETEQFTSDDIFRWSMGNTSENAYIHAEENIRLSRAALWAVDHMISLESFHDISLQPDESDSWDREWIFSSLEK